VFALQWRGRTAEWSGVYNSSCWWYRSTHFRRGRH
jgi:hypothetical protein